MKDAVQEIKELFAAQDAATDALEAVEEVDVADDVNEVEEPAEDVVEGEEEATEEFSDDDQGEDQGDEPEIRNLADLASQIDVDPAFLYSLEVPMGEGVEPTTLGELKDRYQETYRAAGQMYEQLEQLKHENETLRHGDNAVTVSQEVEQAMVTLKGLQQEYQQMNWQALEAKDPGKAALLRQKYNEAVYSAQVDLQNAHKKQDQMKQQRLAHAAQQLLNDIPEWRDPGVRRAEQQIIERGLIAEGYPAQVASNPQDPIAIRLFRELLMRRQAMGAAEGAIQRVRKSPKPLKAKARGGNKPKALDPGKVRKMVTEATPSKRRQIEEAAVKQLLGVK
jgi:hypothetical protein